MGSGITAMHAPRAHIGMAPTASTRSRSLRDEPGPAALTSWFRYRRTASTAAPNRSTSMSTSPGAMI
jgi:hypothetical protein